MDAGMIAVSRRAFKLSYSALTGSFRNSIPLLICLPCRMVYSEACVIDLLSLSMISFPLLNIQRNDVDVRRHIDNFWYFITYYHRRFEFVA